MDDRNGGRKDATERVAEALGWFSLGLGIAQVAAPRMVSRVVGVAGRCAHPAVMRAVGLREIASGVGILGRSRPTGWLWLRVVGDAMDVLLLKAAMAERRAKKKRIAAAIGAVAGVAVPDVVAGSRLARGDGNGAGARVLHAKTAITVRKPREEVYAFWRRLEDLPSFMTHLESVEVVDEHRTRWTASAPGGRTVRWDAETVAERENELIAWRSLPGSEVENAGTVRFKDAPRGRGTEVHLELRYEAPFGAVGAVIAKLTGEEPGQQAKDDLRRFKQLLEAGEIVVSEGSPEGQAAWRQLRRRSAQPQPTTAGGDAR